MRVKTEVDGELRFDRVLKRYQFEDMRIAGEASGEPLQGKTVTYAAQGQILVDLAANVAEWSSLKVSANQLRALGEAKSPQTWTPPRRSAAACRLPSLTWPSSSTASATPCRPWRQGSLSKVELVSRLSGTPTSVTFDELNLKVDDSTFTGRIAVEDFAKQALRIQLKGDTFDADRYLPPKTAEANSASRRTPGRSAVSEAGALAASGDTPLPDAPTKSGWSTAKLIPVTRLKALDLTADISFGQLTLSKLPIQNAALKANSQGGLLTLETLRGDLYKGTLPPTAAWMCGRCCRW
jgi:AsmA protein